jgi:hypothetical protein
MGTDSPFSTRNLNSTALDAAAKRKYLGQPAKRLVEIQSIAQAECSNTPAYSFDCTLWVSKGILRETGFRFVATTGPEEEVKTIEVSSESRYFGKWRPQASMPR